MIYFKKLRWRNFLSTGNQFIEIDLAKSQSTLIIGTNGSGKSTILKHILGIYHPTQGHIKVLGQELIGMSEKEIRKFRTTML